RARSAGEVGVWCGGRQNGPERPFAATKSALAKFVLTPTAQRNPMPTRLRTSLLASCLALTLASLVAGCSASDDSSPSDAPQATESAGDTTTADDAGPDRKRGVE